MPDIDLMERNREILKSWLRMIKEGMCNKTMLANHFDISPRSVGRVLQSFGLEGKEDEDTEIINHYNVGLSPESEHNATLEAAYNEVFGSEEDFGLNKVEEDEPDDEPEELDDFEGEFETERVVDPSLTIYDYSIARKYVNIIMEDGDTICIPDTSKEFTKIRDELLNGNDRAALELASKKVRIIGWSGGRFAIRDNQLYIDDEAAGNDISELVIDAFINEQPFTHFLKFYEKMMDNPSYKVVTQLIPFLKHNDIRINEDGNIVALKVVSATYRDLRTGRFDNSVGESPKMPRNQVEDDPTVSCSKGLHVCARHYLTHPYVSGSSNRMIEVHINPRDVVSVPYDYDGSKCRVCKYYVAADVTEREK